MSILIKGMEMPTRVLTVEIHPDGYVCLQNGNKVGEAVPVPPHGRLIDADALEVHDGWMNEERERNVQQTHITFVYSNDIVNAPTIIPAEPSEEQREYEAAVEAAQYCEMYEPTYDPETGAM